MAMKSMSQSQSISVILPNNSDTQRKTNTLINKVYPFVNNFNEAYSRQKNKSVKYQLANNLFGKGQIQQQSQVKNPEAQKNKDNKKKSTTFSKSMTKLSTESYPSYPMLNILKNKTMTVPQYNKLISNLLMEKQMLINKNDELKRKIMFEKKFHNKIQINSSKHMNHSESKSVKTNKTVEERQRLIAQIDLTSVEIVHVVKQQKIIKSKIEQILTKTRQEQAQIKNLEQYTNKAKKSILKTQSQLSQTKSNLTAALKSLQHNSELVKELQNERAVVLLSINQSFEDHKLK